MSSRKTWSYRQLTQKLEDDIDYWINAAAGTHNKDSIGMYRLYASGALMYWQAITNVMSAHPDYQRLESRLEEIGNRPTVVRKSA